MADELLETYVRQLIEAHAGIPEVTVAWQGGEPTLMGLEFFRRSVELAERHLGRASVPCTRSRRTARCWTRSGRPSSSEHEFLVGISIDGPREMHDTYRVNKGGQRPFDQRDARARSICGTPAWSGTC